MLSELAAHIEPVLLCRCLSLKFSWRLNSQVGISYFHSNESLKKVQSLRGNIQRSLLWTYMGQIKGISLFNLGLCLSYLYMTVCLLSELAATQATPDFIFMTSERSGGKKRK